MSDAPPPPAGPAPLISVALCVHNGERYLRAQIDSLLAQMDVRIEVVALDDASADGSAALLQTYAEKDARLRWVASPDNLGILRSFEKAMSMCNGAFIAPCDQDDIWHPRKLATLLAAIGECDLVYCDSEYIDADARSQHRRISHDLEMMQGREPLQFVFSNSVSGHAALLRRSLFDAARSFPAGVYHDWWLALCAAARGGIVYVDEPLVQFRRHGSAFSTLGHREKTRSPARNCLWLEQRRNLLKAYAERPLKDHEHATNLLAALDTALRGGRRRPLLYELWRIRKAVRPQAKSAALHAIRLQLRFLRKLRRARKEPRTQGLGL